MVESCEQGGNQPHSAALQEKPVNVDAIHLIVATVFLLVVVFSGHLLISKSGH
jgi:hypothetical protein